MNATLRALGELFVRHGVQDVFGVHLLHGHFIAPEGTVLLGTEAKLSEQSSACWTKPVLMAELASKAVHGHVFRLLSNGTFVPYQLQEGEINAKAASSTPELFQELALLSRDTNLADLVTLQLLDDSQNSTMMELLVGPQSTLMVNEKDLSGFDPRNHHWLDLQRRRRWGPFLQG